MARSAVLLEPHVEPYGRSIWAIRNWKGPPRLPKYGAMRATFALMNTHFDNKVLSFERAVQSCNLPWWFGINNWIINKIFDRCHQNKMAATGRQNRPAPIENVCVNEHSFDNKVLSFERAVQSCNLPWWFGINNQTKPKWLPQGAKIDRANWKTL